MELIRIWDAEAANRSRSEAVLAEEEKKDGL